MDYVVSMDYLIYLGVGCIAGLLSGLLGLGGGVVIVPTLILSFAAMGLPDEVMTHIAVATSLACILLTSPVSLYSHYRAGNLRSDILHWLLPAIAIGSMLGGALAVTANGRVLQFMFGALQIALGLQLLFNHTVRRLVWNPQVKILQLLGLMAGTLSAMLGIGGGSLVTPFLTIIGVNIRHAIAAATAAGFVIAAFSSLVYVNVDLPIDVRVKNCIGLIYLPAFLGISLTSMPAARMGALLVTRIPATALHTALGALMLLLGLHFIWLNIAQYLGTNGL